MKLLKYEAGRGQRNLGRNQVTQPAYGGLKLEILDRKTEPSAGGWEGRPRAVPWQDPDAVIVIRVLEGKVLLLVAVNLWFYNWSLVLGFHFGLCSNKVPLAQNLSHLYFFKSKD